MARCVTPALPRLPALLALLCLLPSALGQTPTPDVPGFDFFLFVRQYHPTHCAQTVCAHDAQYSTRFTVHGLWPEYNDGGWPQYCDADATFDEASIREMVPTMRRVWPSWTPDNEEFWSHEWRKHGTCAQQELGYTEHSYFAAILDMHFLYNIEDKLKAAGIVPSAEATYERASMEAALEAAHGARPVVQCSEGGVSEVWMCARKDTLELFDCPLELGAANACDDVRFPPPKRRSSAHVGRSTA